MAFFFMYLRQEQRRRRTQQYAADLANTGNVATPFDVRLEEPANLLGFEIFHNNELLPEKQTAAPVEPNAASKPGAKKDVIGAARQVGGFGSSLLTILPQPLAKPLAAMLKGLSQSVMAATRADSLVKSGQKMGKKAGALVPAGGKAETISGSPAAKTTPNVEMKVIDRWYETPPVPPGASLELTIFVDWQRGLPGHRYPFRLLTQASQQPESERLTTSGVVVLPGERWWVQALPLLFGVAASAAAALFILMVAVTVTILL
jgi:hypothetical protein